MFWNIQKKKKNKARIFPKTGWKELDSWYTGKYVILHHLMNDNFSETGLYKKLLPNLFCSIFLLNRGQKAKFSHF